MLPGDRPPVGAAVRAALAERRDAGARSGVHVAAPRFVGRPGPRRARADGRAAQPAGHRLGPRGRRRAPRPAHAAVERRDLGAGRAARAARRAAYTALGTADEPGTTLLTLAAPGARCAVREVRVRRRRCATCSRRPARPAAAGRRLPRHLGDAGRRCAGCTVSVAGLRERRGAARRRVLVAAATTARSRCTSRIVAYLAGQSAGRCGPCRNGLPALAAALPALDDGGGDRGRVEQLAALVAGRGRVRAPRRHGRGWCGRCSRRYPDEVAGTARHCAGAAARRRRRGAWPREPAAAGRLARAARRAGCATSCCPSWSSSTSGATRSCGGEVTDDAARRGARAAVRICPRLAPAALER